ncbi:hypothetical protein [Mycobacteroides abscessus]|uniref:hypothetical protein n=1 Tax=Mycobacteroides abscessus TaxID=36809 RepID=UPI0012FFDDA6|nr:hypothetical protein [Mycobacteroides abscessus]
MTKYPECEKTVDDHDRTRDQRRHVVGDDHLPLMMTASHHEALSWLPAATSPVVKPCVAAIQQATRNPRRYRHEQDAAQDHP